MKKTLIGTFICLCALLAACGRSKNNAFAGLTNESESQIMPAGTAATDILGIETTAVLENAGEKDMNTMPKITVSVGGKVYQARLYNNGAASELIERMPLELNMEELNGNEKFYYLPESLSADTENIGNIHTGDIMLYGKDCLVLFYKDFQTSFNYTRIGYLEEPDGLSDALGSGTANVLFDRAE